MLIFKKTVIALLMCPILLANSTMMHVDPDNDGTEKEVSKDVLEADIVETVTLMEDLLTYQYNKTKDTLMEKASENHWNESITEQVFDETPNPYDDLDYESTLAALCIAVGNSAAYNVTNIKFLQVNYEEKTVDHEIPQKAVKYMEAQDGYYYANGIQYITQSGTYPKYETGSDGKTRQVGTEYIQLQTEQIQYGYADMKVSSVDEILKCVGLSLADVQDEYDYRFEKIHRAGLTDEELKTSTFINVAAGVTCEPEVQSLLENLDATLEGNRRSVIDTAVSLLGQVPYQWGGKCEKAGYDRSWWTFDENGEQKGLDCSGYVQWVFRTAGYDTDIWKNLLSTASILNYAQTISQDELQPGDLGILNYGDEVNHVGIYLGDGYYIHCNAGVNNVSISKPNFSIFMRVPDIDTAILMPEEQTEDTEAEAISYSEDDLKLAAQTVWHEARGEGMNCWIAVSEVIRNRVKSGLYPDNIHDVVYQESEDGNEQFSYNEEIETMEPSEAEIAVVQMVLDGKIGILNDPNVLYFRDPGDVQNNDAWGSFPFVMRINDTVFYKQS